MRPYNTPITLVLPMLELANLDEWPEHIDILAFVGGKAYEVGIRNIKCARIGTLLEEVWLTAVNHYSVQLERQVSLCHGKAYPLPESAQENMYVSFTWRECPELAREIQMEILEANGGQLAHGYLSHYATLHCAICNLLKRKPVQEASIDVGTMVRTISQEIPNPVNQATA